MSSFTEAFEPDKPRWLQLKAWKTSKLDYITFSLTHPAKSFANKSEKHAQNSYVANRDVLYIVDMVSSTARKIPQTWRETPLVESAALSKAAGW